MKKFLLLALLLVPILSYSQFSTVNPDTVCYQSNLNSTYQVPNVAGNVYTWTVSAPGVLISGQGSNQIDVDWSLSGPGLINGAISVYATNANGCVSPTVTINVFVYNVIPIINSIGPFCLNDACVNLVANPSGGIFSGTGVVNNTFCPNVNSGNSIITYTYQNAGCTFTSTLPVTVFPLPTINPIEHD